MASTDHIKFGDGLTVTDEGGGTIRVDSIGAVGPTGATGATGPQGPAGPGLPVGAPIPWLVSAIPSGYREFDGSAIVQATHPQLYALYGATIPDLRDRVLLGASAGKAVGTTGGADTVTLTAAQSGLPAHGHVGAYNNLAISGGGAAIGSVLGPFADTGNQLVVNNPGAPASQSHSVLQPYRAVRWITVAA